MKESYKWGISAINASLATGLFVAVVIAPPERAGLPATSSGHGLPSLWVAEPVALRQAQEPRASAEPVEARALTLRPFDKLRAQRVAEPVALRQAQEPPVEAPGDPSAPRPFDKLRKRGAPPVPLTKTLPVYPLRARRLGIEGSVEVAFVITPAGKVAHPSITHTTHSIFNNAALTAIAGWTYPPAPNLSASARVLSLSKYAPRTASLVFDFRLRR